MPSESARSLRSRATIFAVYATAVWAATALLISTTALAAGTTHAAGTHGPATVRSAAERVEALLAATGGRGAWANARGYRVRAVHHVAEDAAPFANEILFDFHAARFRVDSWPGGAQRSRTIDFSDPASPRHWRYVEGRVGPVDPGVVATERAWWHGNVYRTLHRLARRDPAIAAHVTEDDRLQLVEDGRPLAWFRQNASGEPIAYAPGDAVTDATIFGPLVQYGPLRFPSFSVRDQGRWRAIIREFVVDPDLAPERFAPPG